MQLLSYFVSSSLNSPAASRSQSPRSQSSSLLITKSRRRLLERILSAEDKINQLMSHSTRESNKTNTTPPSSDLEEQEEWVDEVVVVEGDTIPLTTPVPSLSAEIDFSTLELTSNFESDYIDEDFAMNTFEQPGGLHLIIEGSDDDSVWTPQSDVNDRHDVEKYIKLGDILGRGSSGLVFTAMDSETCDVVALKETPLGFHDGRNQVENEIDIVSELNDEELDHFVVVTDSGIVDDALISVTPYMNGGTLESLIQSGQTKSLPVVNEETIRHVANQVLIGLDILHRRERPIIHNDIKPANILLSSDGDAKLCDFGLSRQLTNGADEIVEYRGTVRYFAPEKFRKYNHKVDIWAFGLSLYECVAGSLPATSDSFHAFHPDEKILGCVSTELRDFILSCLVEDPLQRTCAFELLSHAFLSERKTSLLRPEPTFASLQGEDLLIEIAQCLAEQKREWIPECRIEDMQRTEEKKIRNICRATGLGKHRVRRTIATLLSVHR